MDQTIQGSCLAAQRLTVNVEMNEEAVKSISAKLSTTLHLGNSSIANVISMDETEECFAYALSCVLSRDSGAKPIREVVPNFLSDIQISLNMVYRSTPIDVAVLNPVERPNSYDRFVDVLMSIGIPVGKMLPMDPAATSGVLKAGIASIGGVDYLVGVDQAVSVEELVVRAMLTVQKSEQEKLSRIVGHMDNMYVSVDELLRNWACSLPVGKRG